MTRVRHLLACLLLLAVACSGEPAGDAAGDDRPLVVATVAPLTDLVRRVAGDTATVRGLVPDGVDSHTFEPSPSHAAQLSRAVLFVANGLGLEEPSIRLAEVNLPEGAPIVRLGEAALDRSQWVYDRSFPREDGLPNPHVWLDVVHAIRYVELIADALHGVVPERSRHDLRRNAERLTAELGQLHDAIGRASDTVPRGNRKLVTYHDSWAYFGPRYGFGVVAAVQPPGLGEPSAEDVRRLVDQIRAERVPAVFGSEVFPSDVLQVVAQETGVRFVGDLADDALPGEPGDPEHSYVGMMVRNVRIVVEALGGDARALDDVDPGRSG